MGPLQAVGVVGLLYVSLCQIRVVLLWQFITKVHEILREPNSLKQNALLIILSQEVREELFHAFGESRQTHDLFASWSGLRVHLEERFHYRPQVVRESLRYAWEMPFSYSFK